MLIVPRHRLIHPTLQPIHSAMKHRKPKAIVNVRVRSTPAACAAYRESADLLRQLGCDVAAELLEVTAMELSKRPGFAVRPRPVSESDTVVKDVDQDHDTLSNAEIPA